MRSAKHIVFLESEDWAFCQHRLPLARAARDAGYRVSLVAPAGERVEEIRAEGFGFEPLRMRRTGTSPLAEARSVGEIARIYRRIRPDLVHQIAIKPVLYGTIAARLAGVPAVVNSITGLGYAFIGDSMKRRALRQVISTMLRSALATRRVRCVFQNPDDRDVFVSRRLVDPSRTVIVRGSGVDTDRFAPAPEPPGVPIVLLASRLLWDKGIGELIEAVRTLKAEGLTFRLILAGTPDPANPASIPQATLSAWEREGLVELPGFVRDMAPLLRQSHIACLPSYREGLPLFLLEAAATGLPCVTTDVPGCREAVLHGQNGLLVPVRTVAPLANALRTLLADTTLRRNMGHRGRALALEHFAVSVVVRGIFEVYGALLRT